MTKESDAWDARYAERMAKRQAWMDAYAAMRKIEDHKARERQRIFGMWDWGPPNCMCHGIEGCRDRTCRTIAYWTHHSRCRPRSDKQGTFYALWAIIGYLQDVADGAGPSGEDFGKRFAHRKHNNAI